MAKFSKRTVYVARIILLFSVLAVCPETILSGIRAEAQYSPSHAVKLIKEIKILLV